LYDHEETNVCPGKRRESQEKVEGHVALNW